MPDFATIAADFKFLDDWDERYKYLIDLGRALPPYPEEKRDAAYKVRGCASQVWLWPTVVESSGRKVVNLSGDSDAHIVKGLVAVLLALYSGKSPTEILNLDARASLRPLDLDSHLTPQRSNGLSAMIARINEIASAA
ncbi:MAG: SufE family protein [Parvularculaceae bacterium]